MKTDIECTVEIEIEAPREAVWELVSDVGRTHEWIEEFESAHQVSAGPPGVGAVIRYTVGPGSRTGTFELVEWEPGSRLAWDGPPLSWAGGGARPRGSFELRDAGEGHTLLRCCFRPQLTGTQVLLAPYLRRWLRRHRIADAHKLKAMLEESSG